VHEVKYVEEAQDIVLTSKVLNDMVDRRFFNLDPLTISLTSDSALISIDLFLTNDSMKPALCTGFPISGFPRTLADGEPLKRTGK
jgi:hypothetical protein